VSKSSAVRSVALVVVTLLALVLRLWNAHTATVHSDELHYVGDAYWAASPLPLADGLAFLRGHPRHHDRLDPDTGTRTPWAVNGRTRRNSHPCLFAYVTGTVFAVARPSSMAHAVEVGRRVNAIVDALTVPLLPWLTTALGAGLGAGVLAAALYAVFPPAVTYGSIANLDPFLAPLFVLLLVLALRPTDTPRRWLGLGVVTGLIVSAKQTGLVALVVVPLAAIVLGPRSLRGLLLWLVATLAVVAVFTDPLAYAWRLAHPETAVDTLTFAPVARLVANVRAVARPSAYYWLSFSRHGRPLALAMVRLHYVLTPAYLVLGAIALAATAVRRETRLLVAVALPVVLLFAFMLPSDALWRFHVLSPLLCALVASEMPSLPSWVRVPALVVALLAGTAVFWPARPDAAGGLDLGDLLFFNPELHERPSFWRPWSRPLRIHLGAGETLDRLVWLAPGRWALTAVTDGPVVARLDDQIVLRDGDRAGEIDVVGHVHRLDVAFPEGGNLRRLALVRAGPTS
jgi:hypothetical protein